MSKKITYIIIEDNIGAAQNLEIALRGFPDFVFLGHETNVQAGVSSILVNMPDVLFLDVELDDEQGNQSTIFELIDELRKHLKELPEIVIFSGNPTYALKALNEQVRYYLSKPVDPDELIKAVHYIRNILKPKLDKKIFRTNRVNFYPHIDDIVMIEADGSYVDLILCNESKPIPVSKPIGELEAELPNYFVRISRKYIINTKYLKRIEKSDKKAKCTLEFGTKQIEIEMPSKNVSQIESVL